MNANALGWTFRASSYNASYRFGVNMVHARTLSEKTLKEATKAQWKLRTDIISTLSLTQVVFTDRTFRVTLSYKLHYPQQQKEF